MKKNATKKKKRSTTTAAAIRALVAEQREWRTEHEKEVNRRLGGMQTTILALPAKEDVLSIDRMMRDLLLDEEGKPKLATKQDVAPVIDFYNKLVLSAQITAGAGKWGSRAILAVAAILVALAVISGSLKAVIIGIAHWAMGGK